MSETIEGVECLVSEDGMLSRVTLGAEAAMLGAAAVEGLIWRLAACRAAMLPKRTGVLFEGSRINLGEAIRVTTDADGREITAVMHPGLGWVGAVMPKQAGPRKRAPAGLPARAKCLPPERPLGSAGGTKTGSGHDRDASRGRYSQGGR